MVMMVKRERKDGQVTKEILDHKDHQELEGAVWVNQELQGKMDPGYEI